MHTDCRGIDCPAVQNDLSGLDFAGVLPLNPDQLMHLDGDDYDEGGNHQEEIPGVLLGGPEHQGHHHEGEELPLDVVADRLAVLIQADILPGLLERRFEINVIGAVLGRKVQAYDDRQHHGDADPPVGDAVHGLEQGEGAQSVQHAAQAEIDHQIQFADVALLMGVALGADDRARLELLKAGGDFLVEAAAAGAAGDLQSVHSPHYTAKENREPHGFPVLCPVPETAYALSLEPKASIISSTCLVMASQPGFSSLRGS